jgi:short-subunit dehydrogenase
MKDKVVAITGGSSGIGKALAFEFGSHGSKVLITGRNPETLQKTVEELKRAGIQACAFQGDVTLEQDNKRMAEEVISRFGSIDVLINNAGISMRAIFEEVDLSVIRKVLETNFFGSVYATKYCLPEIIRNKGSIVGISSVAGYRGLPARTGYSASKFALNGFLESLRTELLHTGVNVLTACPGFTASNIRSHALMKDGSDQGKLPRNEGEEMSAEECAHYIYKATVRRKKRLILTRQGKLAVILNKWWPSLADKLVYYVMSKESHSPIK